jgi:hypothetical protein
MTLVYRLPDIFGIAAVALIAIVLLVERKKVKA